MKKILLFVVAIISCGLLSASPRSEQQALELAKQTFRSQSGIKRAPSLQRPVWTCSWTAEQPDGTPAFYVFNRGEEDGFVIISADDATQAVLGYSEIGTFDEQMMPDNMRQWLDGYSRAIHHVASAPRQQTAREIRNPHKAKKAYTPVSPICTTTWNQGEPYNLLCPKSGMQRCYTGCVATAAAQIVNVHQYPAKGVGSHSYSWKGSDNRTQTLSANFGNTTYDWANMKDDYSGTSTTAQKNAVATLMYHCGVACDMAYGTDESGANATIMMQGLIQYFDYDLGIRKMLKDYMPETEFVDAISADLQEGRPVFFGGVAPSGGGHAFVCDGIDQAGLLHINWGWGGLCDGYFVVSVFNPEDQGIGGTADNESFTENVEAYTGIRPNAGGTPSYLITADALYLPEQRIGRSDWPVFYLDVFANSGITSWAGTEALMVYQNNELVYVATGEDKLALDPYTYYEEMYIYGSLESLPAGEYELVPGLTVADQEGVYVPLYTKNMGICRCPMTVTSDSIFLAAPEPKEPDLPGTEVNPNEYIYTDLNGYLYPSALNDAHLWTIQLATSAFYDKNADDNQLCMLFTIASNSAESFLGSFAENTDATAQCYGVTIYSGNINTPKKHQTDGGELTIVYNSASDTYMAHYMVAIDGVSFSGHVDLPASDVSGMYGEAYQTHAEYDDIKLNNSVYTSLTSTQALAMMRAHGAGWGSLIPYVIGGEISQLINTPAEIAQNKSCRLYLSDGTSEISCNNIKWLNNTDFVTGNEIEVGASCCIVGYMKHPNDATMEMNVGYFCSYEAAEEQPKPLEYDADKDFTEQFLKYQVDATHLYKDGYAFVEATNDNNAYINLIFLVGSGVDEIPADTYVIDTTFTIGKIYAGQGVDSEGYLVGSFADYLNEEGGFTSPLWFLVSGTVTLGNDGVITVKATNSLGKAVNCVLWAKDDDAVENVLDDNDLHAVRKVMHNGQIYIIRDGVTYSIQGVRVASNMTDAK